jgi:hypothetical protein
VPSPEGKALCDKGERECILLGRRSAGSIWDQDLVVMLVARRAGCLQRLAIADLPEDFGDMADKSWELVALG